VYVYDVVVKKFTSAISSPDEFLVADVWMRCSKINVCCSCFSVISIFLYRHQNIHEAKLLQSIMRVTEVSLSIVPKYK